MNPGGQGRQIDDGTVERLLRARHAHAPERECPGLELIALVTAGGAGPAEMVAAREHLQQCASCAETVLQDQAHLAAPDTAAESAVEGRVESAAATAEAAPWWRRARDYLTLPRLAPALAAAGLVAIAVPLWREAPAPGPDTLVAKGEADAIFVAAQRGEQRFTVRPRARLEEGDQLGIFYTAEKAGSYLLILGVDSGGHSTQLFPAAGERSVRITAGERVPLPDGAVVGAGSGCEWMVGLFSETPLSVSAVRAQIAAAPRRPDGCTLDLAIDGARTVAILPVQR